MNKTTFYYFFFLKNSTFLIDFSHRHINIYGILLVPHPLVYILKYQQLARETNYIYTLPGRTYYTLIMCYCSKKYAVNTNIMCLLCVTWLYYIIIIIIYCLEYSERDIFCWFLKCLKKHIFLPILQTWDCHYTHWM